MPTKFILVICLTAIGQILSVLFYPLMSSAIHVDVLSQIALIEASMALVVSLLGFGINATTTRDVALSGHYINIVRDTQRARITFALTLTIIAILAYCYDLISLELFYTSSFSIVIALNYDYVLYGLGKPVHAAIASFVRLAMPLIIFIAGSILGVLNSSLDYMALLIISLLLSSFIVSRFCKTPLLYKPTLNFYKVYINAGWIGLAGLSLVFIRIGFVPFLGNNFDNDELVLLMIVLKLGLFAIAGKRILIQFFYKSLLNEQVYSRINNFLTASGVFCILIVALMWRPIEVIFINSDLNAKLCFLASFYIFAMLFFPLSDAKLILLKKDKVVFVLNSVFFLILLFILLFFKDNLQNVYDVVATLVVIEFAISLSLFLFVQHFKRKE